MPVLAIEDRVLIAGKAVVSPLEPQSFWPIAEHAPRFYPGQPLKSSDLESLLYYALRLQPNLLAASSGAFGVAPADTLDAQDVSGFLSLSDGKLAGKKRLKVLFPSGLEFEIPPFNYELAAGKAEVWVKPGLTQPGADAAKLKHFPMQLVFLSAGEPGAIRLHPNPQVLNAFWCGDAASKIVSVLDRGLKALAEALEQDNPFAPELIGIFRQEWADVRAALAVKALWTPRELAQRCISCLFQAGLVSDYDVLAAAGGLAQAVDVNAPDSIATYFTENLQRIIDKVVKTKGIKEPFTAIWERVTCTLYSKSESRSIKRKRFIFVGPKAEIDKYYPGIRKLTLLAAGVVQFIPKLPDGFREDEVYGFSDGIDLTIEPKASDTVLLFFPKSSDHGG